ncbi:MAG: hypothetical protein ACLRFE_03105 [Clostridia bacterium]
MKMTYDEFVKMRDEHERKRQAKLKKLKRVTIATVGLLLVATITLGVGVGVELSNKDDEKAPIVQLDDTNSTTNSGDKHKTKEQAFKDMQKVLNIELETYEDYYKDPDGVRRKYKFAHEEDVLELSKDMSIALEDYFRACGAKYWTNSDDEQFWPKNIDYIITAMAFKESTYRTNAVSDRGCKGLTGLDKVGVLDSLDNWLIPRTWGDDMKHISFDASKVDVFNPTTCMEYTYYYTGYHLVHWFKKDRKFIDEDGVKKCIWDTVEYSEEMQTRMVIATHFYGIGNMLDAIYNRPNEQKKIIPLDNYIYSDYVEDILAKTNELIDTYENNLTR